MNPADRLVAVSLWIDNSPSYAGLDPETHTRRRVDKITAENGEVHDALSGMLGENPRKGVTATHDDVLKELLDVAVAALGAFEHETGNQGHALGRLYDHIAFVYHRAGLAADVEAVPR